MTNRFARQLALGLLLLCGFGAAQAQVVISQVYGGGGNSGATLKNDFIELRNNGAIAVSLDGWSVQYASAAGTTWSRTNLAGSIAPGGYYLIQQAQGAGGTADLPAPDATGTIAMAAGSGKVALVQAMTSLAGSCPLGGAVIDFVGYGSSANCFEGAGPTATLTNTTAALRKGDGSVDTDNNNNDFTTGAPNPRNSGSEPPPPPDPAVPLSIAQIQGTGLESPHVGKTVVTEGIVIARKFNNGFFLQSASDDGDPATSEGIFVFSQTAPPASAAVGNRVRVTGKVGEFTPASNPNQLSITQLVEPVVELLDTGHPLPAAIELAAADLGPEALPGTLERLEGMRVSVARARVVAPSGGSINESQATSSSDGVFHVVLPEVARPFREPGIGVLDVIPIPADKNPPRFDTNPERLMVRSRGQAGATALALDVDAEVEGLVGVLDYFAGTWALLPDVGPIASHGGKLPEAVNDPRYEEISVGSFNLLRLFDDIADGNGGPTLTAAALDRRLAKASAAICDFLKAPDILGVVEVEGLRVLNLLAERINASCPRAPAYVAFLEPGNDPGGINVGFLASTRAIGPGGEPRVVPLQVQQYGKDATTPNPNGSTSVLNDRPPLLLRAVVRQDNGASYPLTVIVNHLRSLSGIDSVAPGSNGWPTNGHRIRAKRGAQAAYLAGLVESLQQADPGERIVLVGDFNAFEFNDGYVDVLGVVSGFEAAEDEVLTYVDSPLTVPLVDGSQLIGDPAQRYSYVFAGNAQTLDHVLVNRAVAEGAVALQVEHARINADFGVHHFGDATTPVGSSDHDPVVLRIVAPSFRSADLSVSASAERATLRVGEVARFAATVRNAGPNDALSTAVAFVFDALVSPAVTAPAGWACTPPQQGAADTTVSCTVPVLAANDDADFALEVIVGDALGGRELQLGVAAVSQITDPANADNQALATVAVLADADLAVALAGPAKKLIYNRTETFTVSLRNAGPDAAWQPRVTLRGDAPAANVAIAAPAGWDCEISGADGDFEAACALDTAFAAGARQDLDFRIRIPARSNSTQFLQLTATATAATPDPQAGNDTATYRNRIVGVP
ncbi:MAG: lamin tail domain-containing protein [Pseudomonadota bacterium]|nr:lamin tail domain-containing protein [Pseudomonadota bacterium]